MVNYLLNNLILKLFIKDYKNISDSKVRDKYGYLSGVVGVFINLLLFILKMCIGLLVNSVTMIADAINDLGDVLSAFITIISAKISSMPSNKKHPFGAGRIEYIASLIVSFTIILAGIQIFKSSVTRIITPEPLIFNIFSIIVMLFSIPCNLFLSSFNIHLGKATDSSVLIATGKDAFDDLTINIVVLSSLVITKLSGINVDAFFGLGLSIFIIYQGIGIAKDVLTPLLGGVPDKALIQDIKNISLEHQYVNNVHDIIVNNYGYGKDIISLHIETPQDISALEIYNSVIAIEEEITDKYKSHVIIQVDPTVTNDIETIKVKMSIIDISQRFDYIDKINDFRIIESNNSKILLFNVVLKDDYTNILKQQIEGDLNTAIQYPYPGYTIKINSISREGTYI